MLPFFDLLIEINQNLVKKNLHQNSDSEDGSYNVFLPSDCRTTNLEEEVQEYK